MTESDARKALSGRDLVAALEGPLVELKRVRDRCLDAGIPAILERSASTGKS